MDFFILKYRAGLQLDRHHRFHREVAPHVIHSRSARQHVSVKVFQPAKMTLIGTVEDVLAGEIERENAPATAFYVRSSIDVEQCV